MKSVNVSASAEDYLLALFLLKKKGSPVKVVDIGRMLNISGPSTTEALGKLSVVGLVKHQKYGDVELTLKGDVVAQDIHLRYETLRRFLFQIAEVPLEVAERDALGMKHALSTTSREKIAGLMESISEYRLIKETSVK